MARSVRVHLLDDFDGSPADETVRFALDGVGYEVDLTRARAAELREALAGYMAVARRSGRGVSDMAGRSRRTVVAVRGDRNQNQAIREWARRSNIPLNSRGRIPRDIVEKFEAQARR